MVLAVFIIDLLLECLSSQNILSGGSGECILSFEPRLVNALGIRDFIFSKIFLRWLLTVACSNADFLSNLGHQQRRLAEKRRFCTWHLSYY